MVRKLVVDVPEELKAEFKIYCMKNGTSIHSQIIEFMQATLDGTEEDAQHEDQKDGSSREVTEPTTTKVSGSTLKKAMEFDVRAFRNALNLKEEKKQETGNFEIDPLDIGL